MNTPFDKRFSAPDFRPDAPPDDIKDLQRRCTRLRIDLERTRKQVFLLAVLAIVSGILGLWERLL
jgi:hypothetical protein